MNGEHVALIASIAVLTYGTRIVGLSMGDRTMPPGIRQIFDRVPLAVFAALAAPGIVGSEVDIAPRVCGAIVALAAFLVVRLFWVGLLAGMVGYAVARWVLG
ncbi:MAG: AzlD domain-containing protein [Thermomicrobiales bacterium]